MSLILDQKYLDKLRRYKVLLNNQSIYTIVTSEIDENIVLQSIEDKFSYLKHPYRIYCNGKIIKKCNYKSQRHFKKILDKETGILYPDLYSFSDNFMIDVNEAKTMIKKLHRFKWIINE